MPRWFVVMDRNHLSRNGLFVCVAMMVVVVVLMWRAHWFSQTVAQQEFPTRWGTVKTEIVRVNPSRGWRTLLEPQPFSAMFYECRIREGAVTGSAFSLRFADGFAPEKFSIERPHEERGDMVFEFSFGVGNQVVGCDYAHGNYARWYWR